MAPNVGNPVLGDEPHYPQVKFPDSGFQILAIYRFWNIIEYWFPYRDLIDEDWDAVLRDSLRKAAPRWTQSAFQREMLALVARARRRTRKSVERFRRFASPWALASCR